MGFVNTLQWYPWPFGFRQTHYALAWVIVGALLLHIAVKLPLIVAHWRRTSADSLPEQYWPVAARAPPDGRGRRRPGRADLGRPVGDAAR